MQVICCRISSLRSVKINIQRIEVSSSFFFDFPSNTSNLFLFLVILSASSEVFQCMLLNNSWQESKESHIVLVEDPQCCKIFPLFLKYLYTGQVRISVESAMPLLKLADKYNIKDLGINFITCMFYRSFFILISI